MRQRLSCLLLISLLPLGALAQIDFETQMSPAEREATGIESLSKTQRSALAEWLEDYVQNGPRMPTEGDGLPDKNWGFTNPPESEAEQTAELRAAIVGPFTGWSGKTVFSLDNGQVWKQRRSGYYRYRGDAREVVISKNRFGFFEMRLLDADRAVGVTRIR